MNGIIGGPTLLSGMMSLRRFGSAALLLLIVTATFAPMASALAQCAMPCCRHTCPVKHCTIQKAPEEVVTLAPPQIAPFTPAETAVAEVAPVSRTVHRVIIAGDAPPDPHRPLHLVNSVFLI